MNFLVSLLLLLSSQVALACDVLMLDLNNSTQEDQACADGVAANDPADGVWILGNNQKVSVNPATVEDKISSVLSHGGCIDSIVISGHDGNGHFFGVNGGILSSELAAIVKRHPELQKSLHTTILWGCYTATDYACQNFWMKNISPGIQAAIGFTLQSPDNQRPHNWDLLKDVCKKRNKIVEATTAVAVTQAFNALAAVHDWQVGICMEDGLCSNAYHRVGEENHTCYHTYEEIQNRCSDYAPSKNLTEEFGKFLAARESGYENPPCDGPDDFVNPNCHKKPVPNKVRMAYDEDEVMRQCAEEFHAETGQMMPDVEQMIRLVKFPLLAANFAYNERANLKTYNDNMAALGLEQDTLRSLGKDMTRAEVVSSTSSAVTDLQRLIDKTPEGQQINGVDPRLMKVMAVGLDLALRELDYHCTDFSWVHEATNPTGSLCLAPYGRSPLWPPQKQ